MLPKCNPEKEHDFRRYVLERNVSRWGGGGKLWMVKIYSENYCNKAIGFYFVVISYSSLHNLYVKPLIYQSMMTKERLV